MDRDYDDRQIEERWCAERREEVIAYVVRERVTHYSVQRDPGWFVAPYVSVSRIGSSKSSDVGWWVICGDLPTDYVAAHEYPHPYPAWFAPAVLDVWRASSNSQAGQPWSQRLSAARRD